MIPKTKPTRLILEQIDKDRDEAERKAWECLARYKFVMFGYWCGVWVHMNRLAKTTKPNPWRDLVETARMVTTGRRM